MNTRALAWRLECDAGLVVTLVVCDCFVLLLSREEGAGTPWRLGRYMNPEEAARRAVGMTSSYERLRNGKVVSYGDVEMSPQSWNETVTEGAVTQAVASAIEEALSTVVVP